MDGQIGPDESALKNNKVIVTAPISGKTSGLKIKEEKEVKAGEELFTLSKDKDSKDAKSDELDKAELTLQIESLIRQVNKDKKTRQELEKEYQKKKEELKNIDCLSELFEIERQIEEQNTIVSMNEELHDEGLIEESVYIEGKTS